MDEKEIRVVASFGDCEVGVAEDYVNLPFVFIRWVTSLGPTDWGEVDDVSPFGQACEHIARVAVHELRR